MHEWFLTSYQHWATQRAMPEPARTHALTLSCYIVYVQYSKLRDVDSSVYHARRLMLFLQPASAASEPIMCLAKFSNRALVNATLQAADWAQACKELRGYKLAQFSRYWVATLHAVMARRAREDAEEVVKLGDGLPDFSSAPVYQHPQPEQVREACSACEVKFQRANDEHVLTGGWVQEYDVKLGQFSGKYELSREWMQEFVIESVKTAGTCYEMTEWMLRSAMSPRSDRHVRHPLLIHANVGRARSLQLGRKWLRHAV